jgi:hypothetical protein
MDRLALLVTFAAGWALGACNSPENRRRWRYWMERKARGDQSRDAADLARRELRARRAVQS